MKKLTRAEAAAWLAQKDNIAIITHAGPDGDTLGSAAGLCLGLRQLGKTAYVLENSQIADKYKYLVEGLMRADIQEGDVLVSVDVAAAKMLSDESRHLADRIDLRIDHHATDTPFAARELVDSTAAACSEIVYDLLVLMGVQLDAAMANALFTAVSTDTGCFRYANTTARTFAVASACAAVSPDLFRITQALFDTITLGRLRLQNWVVEHMYMLYNGQIAVCGIPADLYRTLELQEEDMKNLAGFLRSIQGVKIAATVKQDEEGHTGISVRAVPGYDAAAICVKFGGGGHKGAAGAAIENVTLDEAVQKLIAAMPEI